MSEFVDNGVKAIKAGDLISFEAEKPSFHVGAGVVFDKDGVYMITVKGGKVIGATRESG